MATLRASDSVPRTPEATAGAPLPLGTALLMGSDAPTKVANAMRNTQEGRTTFGMGVFKRV
jgi:hypothetical protein